MQEHKDKPCSNAKWRQRILQRRSARWAKWVLTRRRSVSEAPVDAQPAEHDSSSPKVIYMDLLAANRNEALEAPAPGYEATGGENG